VTGAVGQAVLEVIEAAYRSAADHAVIRLD
jgi:hypothetical protein